MKTELFEVVNKDNTVIRGIVSLPNNWNCKAWVLCLHWFERCSSTEKKFKTLTQDLTEKMFAVLRFDFSWCGLSDGDFRSTTIAKQSEEFISVFEAFKKKYDLSKVNIIAHSLGACVLAEWQQTLDLDKIVLLAPALNQKDLLRYRFVVSQMKKKNPELEITWENYSEYLDESDFQEDCKRQDKMTKVNMINSDYFLEAERRDFSKCFEGKENDILHIHWSKDLAVPPESLNISFKNTLIVENGDHDMEKPDHLEQWKDKVLTFLAGQL